MLENEGFPFLANTERKVHIMLMTELEKWISQVIFYIRMIWLVSWRTYLRLMLGQKFEKIFYNPKLFSIFNLSRLCYVRRTKNGNIVQSRYGSLLFFQLADNVFINDEIFFGEVYERFRKISKMDVVIDVGAHVGVFTLKSGSIASKVISIEPDPHNFKLLSLNIRLNRMNNIVPVNIAVADYNGKAKLYLGSQSGLHSLLKASHHSIDVEVKKLDDLIKELKVERISFLKIDVEGAEFLVLKGALNILKKYKPFISMEYHYESEKSKILSLLKSLNYFYQEDGGYIYAFCDIA
jgi:FkbM family methyltransferase